MSLLFRLYRQSKAESEMTLGQRLKQPRSITSPASLREQLISRSRSSANALARRLAQSKSRG